MNHDATWIPLFPLKAVLFPDGVLPIKVVETCCIDMIRDCMRRDSQFGVVLLKSGSECSELGEPENIGCVAHITSWDMPQLGVLKLRTRGGTRFRIRQTRRLANKQLEAQIDPIRPDAPILPAGAHVDCADTLKIIIDDLDRRQACGMEKLSDSPFTLPIRLDDTGWVADRWSEILPLPLKARQKLLEVEDAQSRMDLVLHLLKQEKVLNKGIKN
ncbi:MAG: LON peptidase substrate-binding domain-containing protein [Pseudomonadota bacterium]